MCSFWGWQQWSQGCFFGGDGSFLTEPVLLRRLVGWATRQGRSAGLCLLVMRLFSLLLVPLLAGLASCHHAPASALVEARAAFHSHIVPSSTPKSPPEAPPAALFRLVGYPSKVGDLQAYLSPDPGDGQRHPAIIWLAGGDCNSIGDVWSPSSPDNDQSAAAFRQAGVLMLFPSLRGGNANPGTKEGFLGEVDDVLAATAFLKKQPYVDSARIYLGGHSTGGTLALLVAESSAQYRAVFALGAVADVAGYGAESGFLPFDITDTQEVKLRSPGYWLGSMQSPLWAIEGTDEPSNIDDLRAMRAAHHPAKAHFLEVKNATHFGVLAPSNQLLAQKILADTGPTSTLTIMESELNRSLMH